jgi:hypothetical protein
LIQPLPSHYLLASGSDNTVYPRYSDNTAGKPALRLTAWMPDRHGCLTFAENLGENDDDAAYEEFYNDNCRNCDYYFNQRTLTPQKAGVDEEVDGNEIIDVTIQSCCPCYREGVASVDFPCAAGYDEPERAPFSGLSNDTPPMAYAVDVHPVTGERLWDGAWMQRINTVTRIGTQEFPTFNTYGDRSICWGNDNTTPQDLPEIIEQVLDSPANEDLLDATTFARNRSKVREAVCDTQLSGSFIPPGDDAALLVHCGQQSIAYLLLRGSGFEAHNGVIAVGLRRHVHEHEGQRLEGYITKPGHQDLCWFLVHETSDANTPVPTRALLLGQIPNPEPVCTSTALSSSEPAALAVS